MDTFNRMTSKWLEVLLPIAFLAARIVANIVQPLERVGERLGVRMKIGNPAQEMLLLVDSMGSDTVVVVGPMGLFVIVALKYNSRRILPDFPTMLSPWIQVSCGSKGRQGACYRIDASDTVEPCRNPAECYADIPNFGDFYDCQPSREMDWRKARSNMTVVEICVD